MVTGAVRVAIQALLIAGLWATGCGAQEELRGRTPPREARSVVVDQTFPTASQGDASLWSFEVRALGARYLRIEFADIQDRAAEDYEVVLLGSGLRRIASYSKQEFARRSGFWSAIVPGEYVRVMMLTPNGNAPTGLTYRIVQYLFESPSAVLQSVRDPRDPKLKPVSFYAADLALQQAARSVAKLRNVGRDGLRVCTGFMVASDLLLSNEHCVPDARICARMLVYFDWDPTREDASKRFECVKLETVNRSLDFALVRLNARAGDAQAWGSLSLAAREVPEGENLYVIQYPGVREPKQVARENCALSKPTAPGVDPAQLSDFGHTCDTKQGSSGSPVLALDNRVIGLHHWGFDLPDRNWNDQNRAVRIAAIAAAIADLVK